MGLKASNKLETNRYELEIEVSAEDFAKAVDVAYNKQKGKITVPGFRKGKAPKSFIERYYGEQIFYEDAINELYPDALENASKEAGLELVDDHIDFELVKLDKKEGLIFKVKVTVMPEVTVENYKGIEVEHKPVPRVTAEKIDERLKAIQQQNARLVTSEDGSVENGDVVNIDFEGSVDGVKFDGGTAEGVDLEIGKKQFIEGFEDQLIGHKNDEEFEINVTFPENYHVATLKGKPAVFKIKINKIQKKELPEIDDEFVKDISEFENLEDYKKDLKKKMSDENKQKVEREVLDEIMDKFISLVKAEIPEALIKNRAKELLRDFEYKLSMQGLKFEDYLKYTGSKLEDMIESYKPQAEKNVKLDLGIKKVAELEKIEVSDEDLEKEFEEIAKSYSMKPEQVKKFVRVEDVKKELISRKTIELIKDSAVEK